jgi:N-acyl-D-amino-acid deacylase
MSPTEPAKLDLVIKNGTVVDGSGRAAFAADVAVAGDRIVEVGSVQAEAARTIDAAGCVVAPGFIDVHTHDDLALVRDPRVDFKVMQGVTTDVVGNCGVGAAPASDAYRHFYRTALGGILGPAERFDWNTTAEYYRTVEQAGPSLNVASFVPHGILRFLAMGVEQRAPSPSELAAMKELLAEGMAAGALGMSTGLIYPPGMFAATDELIELCRVVADHGGMYASHIRNEGDGLLEAVEEAIRIGEESGVRVQLSHHKAVTNRNWGRVEQSLALVDEARARGLDVTVDVYPYTAGSTALAAMMVMRGEESLEDEIMVASVKHQHEYEGMTIQQIAERMGLPPTEAAARLLREEENAVVVILFVMCEEDVQRVMRHETAMFGSDGLPSAEGKPHPRLYGTFPRVLGRYVRELGVLGLEEAVRKMTSLPARKHGLAERGEVRPGHFADLVVFDPQTVAGCATYQEPRRYPQGIRHVIVNGRAVVDGGEHTGAAAGRVLRAGG